MRTKFAASDDQAAEDVEDPEGLGEVDARDEFGQVGSSVAGSVVCPECRSAEQIPVVFGYPSPEMWEASERGEIGIGGCVIFEGQPDVQCRNCSTQYNTKTGKSSSIHWD